MDIDVVVRHIVSYFVEWKAESRNVKLKIIMSLLLETTYVAIKEPVQRAANGTATNYVADNSWLWNYSNLRAGKVKYR